MEGIKYIPKSQLFDCSVELSSSRKFFVWDGVPEHPLLSEETGVLDVAASFDVSSRMERLSYSPSLENIPQKAVVIRPALFPYSRRRQILHRRGCGGELVQRS